MSYDDYLYEKPVIVTAALTDGVQERETVPNLSKHPDETVEAALEAE